MHTPPRREPIGVLGLGLMGTALSERLLEHGIPVRVWNRTRAKADPLLARGAVWSDDPLSECPRVLISLFSNEAVDDVLQRFDASLRPGHLIVDTTTGEPGHAVALAARLAARNVAYLDAPISGSSEQTRNGEATVMVGGPDTAFAACNDLWPILGRRVFHVGPSGSAAQMKLITNLVLGLNRAVLAEGLVFAEALGVKPEVALEVMAASPAYSRAMDVKGRKMVEHDFTVQARLSQHLKDVRLMLQAAAAANLRLPLTDVHRTLLEQAMAQGYGELDNSAIIQALRPQSSSHPVGS